MEVSTPTHIIEGSSNVLDISYGVIPGSGECALVSTSSEIFMYSIIGKNVSGTWTFPTNSKECISSGVYAANDHGNLISCQAGSTILKWKSGTASTKSFSKSELKEPSLAFVPMDKYIINISKEFNVSLLSSSLEELQTKSIPVPDEIIRKQTIRYSKTNCALYLLVRYNTQYKAILVQGIFTSKPTMRLTVVDIPVEETCIPIDILYIPSSLHFYFFFSNGSLRIFKLQPNIQTGEYMLKFEQSLPLMSNLIQEPSSKRLHMTKTEEKPNYNISWKPTLTLVNDKCFAYVSYNRSKWIIHFMQSEYWSELNSIEIQNQPSNLTCTLNSFCFSIDKSVYYSNLIQTSLSLSSILRNTLKEKRKDCKPESSHVITANELLSDIKDGIINNEEWKKRITISNELEEEENQLLALKAVDFPEAAVKFIHHRLENNEKIISLSNEFIRRVVGRCISPKIMVTSVLKELLCNEIDISIHKDALHQIICHNDLTILFLYIYYIPVIPEQDLLTIMLYCLRVKDTILKEFADLYKWAECSAEERRIKFLMMMVPQLLRINSNYTELKKCMASLTIENVYSIALLLGCLLINLDSPNKEETVFLEAYKIQDNRLYISSLIEWLNCLFDVNLIPIVLDLKTSNRFKEVIKMLKEIISKDIELYKNLLPLKGVLHHLEQKLPLPVTATPLYAVERIDI